MDFITHEEKMPKNRGEESKEAAGGGLSLLTKANAATKRGKNLRRLREAMETTLRGVRLACLCGVGFRGLVLSFCLDSTRA